jgi:hypothetical protein
MNNYEQKQNDMTTVKTSDFFICTYAYEKRQEDGNARE